MAQSTVAPEPPARWPPLKLQEGDNHHQDDDDSQYQTIEALIRILSYSSAYLLSLVIAIHIIIGICLLFRFCAIILGSRQKPDGKKAILVTGATSGIGLVIAKYFFKLGFAVIAGYYNDQEPGYAELLELSIRSSSSSSSSPDHSIVVENGPAPSEADQHQSEADQQKRGLQKARLFLVKMDVRSADSIERSSQEIDSILDQHEISLFALINNAGVARDAKFEWSSRESIRDVIETNLTGVMMVTRQFLYRIIKSRGRIINVASGLYLFPAPGVSVYGSSKSAVAYFSDALDADISSYGASCRCVVPGNFLTASNILFPRLRCLQESVAKLSAGERELYKESIDFYTRTMDSLVRKRFAQNDDLDPIQVSSIYKVRLPDDLDKRRQRSPARAGLWRRISQWLIQRLDGGAGAESLEKSGLIQGYDYAVRLRNPPRRLYPGDRFYSHFSGPFMDYMPKVICDSFGSLLVSSLKNQ